MEFQFHLCFVKACCPVYKGLGKVLVLVKGGRQTLFHQRLIILSSKLRPLGGWLLAMVECFSSSWDDGQCLRRRNKHCLVQTDYCLLSSLFSRPMKPPLKNAPIRYKISDFFKNWLDFFKNWFDYFKDWFDFPKNWFDFPKNWFDFSKNWFDFSKNWTKFHFPVYSSHSSPQESH